MKGIKTKAPAPEMIFVFILILGLVFALGMTAQNLHSQKAEVVSTANANFQQKVLEGTVRELPIKRAGRYQEILINEGGVDGRKVIVYPGFLKTGNMSVNLQYNTHYSLKFASSTKATIYPIKVGDKIAYVRLTTLAGHNIWVIVPFTE